MKQQAPPPTQRTFILGDSWIFYKIYAGHKISDHLIAGCLFPLAEGLRKKGLIQKWFFIRYHDEAGAHLRFRMEIPKPEVQLGEVIAASRAAFRPMIEMGWIWKVQTDTYQRELERYGARGIVPAERLFFQNSHLIARLISTFQDDLDESARWLFALPAIDQLFDAFGCDLRYRNSLMNILRNNFAQEFGMNAALKQQLEKKYQEEKEQIAAAFGLRSLDSPLLQRLAPHQQLLKQYREAESAIAREILELKALSPDMESLNNLLASYIHMLMNRLFKSKQRVHEMVIYDFLGRHYQGLIQHPSPYTRVQAEAEKLLTE